MNVYKVVSPRIIAIISHDKRAVAKLTSAATMFITNRNTYWYYSLAQTKRKFITNSFQQEQDEESPSRKANLVLNLNAKGLVKAMSLQLLEADNITLKRWVKLPEQLKIENNDLVCSDPVQIVDTLLENFPRSEYVPRKLIETIGIQFPLKEREDMGEQMFLKTLYRFKNRSKSDSSIHDIMVFGAGPGTGKSRVNMEALPLMISSGERLLSTMSQEDVVIAQQLLNLMKNRSVSISITCGNDQGLDVLAICKGLPSLGLRILYHYFVGTKSKMGRFVKLWNNNWPTLEKALVIIREHKLREISDDDNKDVFIYVGIDEFEKYNNDLREQFINMFNDVGRVMSESPHGLFFQPLFTGIDFRDGEIFTESVHNHSFLDPTLLSRQSMTDIVDSMAQQYSCLKELKGTGYFKNTILKTGGVPKVLEVVLYNFIFKMDKDRVLSPRDSIWEMTIFEVRSMYRHQLMALTYKQRLEKAMIISILQQEIGNICKEFLALQRTGLITIHPKQSGTKTSYTLQVPLIWFYIVQVIEGFSKARLMIGYFLQHTNYYAFPEVFFVQYAILMINLRLYYQANYQQEKDNDQSAVTITMDKLFPGALFQNPEMKKWRVKLQPLQFCISEEQFTPRNGVTMTDHRNFDEVDWQKGEHIILNAPLSEFADFFYVLALADDNKKIGIYCKVKHNYAFLSVSEQPEINLQTIQKEYEKTIGKVKRWKDSRCDESVFVMYTVHSLDAKVKQEVLPPNTIIVHSKNFFG